MNPDQHLPRRLRPTLQAAVRPPLRGRWRSGGLSAAVAVSLLLASCGEGDSRPGSDSARGSLVDTTDVIRVTRAEIDSATAASGNTDVIDKARCDVSLKVLIYQTETPDGGTDMASGAVMVPGGEGCTGPFPVVVYDHATSALRRHTMLNPREPESAMLMGLLAAQGYVVVAPDYLGHASSRLGYHPFLHARTAATTTVDAVRAARALLQTQRVDVEARLMLLGYSEGGYASLATQRMMETELAPEFQLRGAAHMSGIYEPAKSLRDALQLLPQGPRNAPLFMTLTLTAYQRIYGDVYASASDYFRAPYDAGIDSLLPGSMDTAELMTQGRLPRSLGELLTERAVNELLDPQSRIGQRLAQNTVLDWTPRVPVAFCGGSRDPVVAFSNATEAHAAMRARGADSRLFNVEAEPAFAQRFPALLSDSDIEGYHSRKVAPACLRTVRDRFMAGLR